MSDIFILSLASFALVISIAALFTVLHILYPRTIAETHNLYEIAPRRSFWFGVVNLLLFGVVFLLLIALRDNSGNDIFYLLALIIAIPPLLGTLFGLAAITKMIGERLLPARNEHIHIAAGSSIVTLACLVPFLGWFGLFPLLAIAGLGASVLASVQRRRAARKDEA